MHPLLILNFLEGLTNAQKKVHFEANTKIDFTGKWPFKGRAPSNWPLKRDRAMERAAHELEHARREGYEIIPMDSPNYPSYLREVADPPMVLFGRGRWNNAKIPLAVVGTRKMTNYGGHVTRELAVRMSEYPINFVSGLAMGVDASMHRRAVEMGATTTAFMAGGMKDISPKGHRKLAQEMLDGGGGNFKEQPFEQEPLRNLFPVRNRLIAGASLATLVVESAKKSGALITANMAHHYERSVFAVPGAWFMPYSQGPNALIEEQLAEAVVQLDDFPGRFYPLWVENQTKLDLSDSIEEAIISLIPHGRKVNSLHIRNRLKAPNNMIFKGLNSLLSLGVIERMEADTYRRKMQ